MDVTLYDWGGSPFCLKVRAILDYKGIAYRRLSVFGRGAWEVRRRGRIGKVPALDIDGRLIVDSTDIAHALERLVPEPPVLPAEARALALCHALEEWADESLYFVGLYYQWWDPAGRAMVPGAFGHGPVGRLAYRYYLRRIRAQLLNQGTGRKPASMVAADLERHLDAVAALLQPGPYLLGERPCLCDFAWLGQLVYLGRPPGSRPALAARPAIGAYLERMRALRAPAAGGGA